MQKREINNYYIATVYYIIGVVLIPFIISLAIVTLLSAIVGDGDQLVTTIAIYVFSIFSLWISLFLASKYINKTYIIKNKDDIVKIVTRYTVIIDGGLRLIQLFKSKNIIELVSGLIFIIVFISLVYYWSKMYIKTDGVTEDFKKALV